ncbi:MAG: hypothetical protein OXE76_09735, partial [Alphaproteobacteria bacterium]|nr:hypothetical protein [Alphaproteobacteria bacterium]
CKTPSLNPQGNAVKRSDRTKAVAKMRNLQSWNAHAACPEADDGFGLLDSTEIIRSHRRFGPDGEAARWRRRLKPL